MANNFNTHTITNYSDQKKGSVLSRLDDGMVIGRRVGCLVAWGEDPRQQQQRAFTDETFGEMFLRKIADLDQKQIMEAAGHDPSSVCAHVEDVDGDRRIVTGAIKQ